MSRARRCSVVARPGRATSLAHARAIIAAWQREYNEERPKKDSALTPAAYALQLTTSTKSARVTAAV
jgi:hypothetical protein